MSFASSRRRNVLTNRRTILTALIGYPAFWVNRTQQPSEELGVGADGVGAGMADLVKFVLAA
jgi:hypothetical protein